MTWQESVTQAIQRVTTNKGSNIFTRQDLVRGELDQIIAQTASTGETPEHTLNRVLQELRDKKIITFEKPGVYKLLKLVAKAYPRKNFFVQMFTKDISLEDCVLDLIDNSVDGYTKSRGLRLSQIANTIWEKGISVSHRTIWVVSRFLPVGAWAQASVRLMSTVVWTAAEKEQRTGANSQQAQSRRFRGGLEN
jgi:hypothetical protein